MFDIRGLEILSWQEVPEGTLLYATYPGWQKKYEFLITSNGEVKGKTSLGHWVSLREESSLFIRQCVSGAGEEKRYFA